MDRNRATFFIIIFLLNYSFSFVFSQTDKPNIIVILADDLGYGEVGYQGQKFIPTPNIDALSKEGKIFTNFYSGAPVCAPARSVLLTGLHSGHTFIRGNDEMASRGKVWNYLLECKNPNLEGQRPLPDSVVTIAEQLKKAGYRTGVFGKWGLGYPGSEGIPTKQGFDVFFGYNCQRQAHNLYPPHLWSNERKIKLRNQIVIPHQKLDSTENLSNPNLYKKFTQEEYAPDVIHDHLMKFLQQEDDHPFFLYYANVLPHLALQAPDSVVQIFHQKIGPEEPYDGSKGYLPCLYPRATYAAMIAILDQQVGDIVKYLKASGEYENTLIIFTSDNGPTYTGGVDFEYFESSNPFTNGYGRTKGFVYEGGIRVPMIAVWPDHIKPNTNSDHVAALYDVYATLNDAAGLDLNPNDGISFLPTLLDKEQTNHPYLYWEFPSYQGQQAARIGNYKAIRKNIFKGNLSIELYDLKSDPQEQFDISSNHPDIIQQAAEIFKKEHTPSPIPRFQIPQLGDK